jgi:hypothetical protein
MTQSQNQNLAITVLCKLGVELIPRGGVMLRLHLLCFSVPDYYAELSFPIGLSSVVT